MIIGRETARSIITTATVVMFAAANPVNTAAEEARATDSPWVETGMQAVAPSGDLSPANAPASITEFTATGESVPAAAAPVSPPAAPTVTTNGLLQFTSATEFDAAFPGLPLEDFEGGTTAAGTFTFCPSPIDSSSTCAGLTIEDGLSITGPPSVQMVVVGSGYNAWAPASTSLSTFAAADTHQVAFSGGSVNAVGFDLTGSAVTTATVNLFGASGLLETLTVNLTTVTQTFTGIYSAEPITLLTITAGSLRTIDNIRFGTIVSNLTFYTNQATFTATHPGLLVEDFEESTVSDTGGGGFTGPLNSSTSNAFFSPGDIVSGLNIDNEPVSTLYASGGNQLNYPNTTKAVATNNPSSNFKISFPSTDVHAVGMDLSYFAYVPSSGNTQVAAFNPFGKFLGMKQIVLSNTTETFSALYSAEAIGSIAILNNTNYEFIDNIRFGGSPAGLTFFDSEASFLAARPGLPEEDFEESTATTPTGCDEPINSTANLPNCFVPGDILPGIAFQTVEKIRTCAVGGCPMAVVPAGFFGLSSYAIGSNMFVDNLEITFAKKNVRYFGSDVIVPLFGPADMLFSIYDDHDNLIGSAIRNIGVTPVYLGFVSAKHVSRITITNPGSAAQLVDNVRFGAFPWPTIIPAISGHAVP